MYLLSIDTTTSYLNIVVSRNGVPLQAYRRQCGRRHSRRLFNAAGSLLDKARLGLEDIGACGISCGPGSFTGIRIGLAAVKGLCMALDIPAAGFSSLDVLACAHKERGDTLLCPVIDAKRSQVYTAVYAIERARVRRLSDYMLCGIDALLKTLTRPALFTGDALAIYRPRIEEVLGEKAKFASERFWYPQSAALAAITYERCRQNKLRRAADLAPLYLYADTCSVLRGETGNRKPVTRK